MRAGTLPSVSVDPRVTQTGPPPKETVLSSVLVNPLPRLELPKRWEFLEAAAKKAGLQAAEFIQRIDPAAVHVDQLLRRVRTGGGGGVFEVLYGLSGSGKTSFLKTLPKFFEDIRVIGFPRDSLLSQLPDFIASTYVPEENIKRVIVIEKRDNPKPADIAATPEMLGELLETFRTPEGRVIVLWPVTDPNTAERIATYAWTAGRDSVTDASTKGIYKFPGLARDRYHEIADLTSRNLSGDGLDAFGVTTANVPSLLSGCETISDFFARVDSFAAEQSTKTWSVLRERVRVHVWVVLPGDLVPAINATVSGLTQGTRSRIDLDLIGEFIDRPDNKAIYIADWRAKRASMAHLLRAIDLRLCPLPPNVALAAVRLYGDTDLKAKLKQPAINEETAKDTMKASRLYKLILAQAGVETTPFAGSRDVAKDTSDEYRRIQSTAGRSDKPLNKALGKLIKLCLADDAPSVEVITEKRSLPKSELQPDIQIRLSEGQYICLEPTWRSTDVGITGELDGGQNTLSEAHLKKYVLDKATSYVKDLGI